MPTMKKVSLSPDVRAYLGSIGYRGAKAGAARMTAAQRTARAKKAAAASAKVRRAKARARRKLKG